MLSFAAQAWPALRQHEKGLAPSLQSHMCWEGSHMHVFLICMHLSSRPPPAPRVSTEPFKVHEALGSFSFS